MQGGGGIGFQQLVEQVVNVLAVLCHAPFQGIFGVGVFAHQAGYFQPYFGYSFHDVQVVVLAAGTAGVVGPVHLFAQVAPGRVFHKGDVTGIGEVEQPSLFALFSRQLCGCLDDVLRQSFELLFVGQQHGEAVGLFQYVLAEGEGQLAEFAA